MASKKNSSTATVTPEDEATIAAVNATPDDDRPSDDATAEAATKAPRWEPIPADRAAWIAQHARPAIAPCLCGCGGTTKGRFVPGHDATLKRTLEVTAATTGDAALAAQEALATFGW